MGGVLSSVDPEKVQAQPGFWVAPLLTLTTFASMLNAMALGPFLPVIAVDLDVSVALLGQIPALTMFLAAFLGFIVGPIADQFGHRRALLIGLGIAVVSSIGIGLAPGYTLLLIAALIGAGSRAIAIPIAVVIAGTLYQGDQQRRAISWVAAGMTGAAIVGIPMMTTIAELYSWRIAFLALGSLSAVLLLVLLRSIDVDPLREDAHISFRGIIEAYRPLVLHRPTAALVGSTLVGHAGIWMMATYVGAFYSARFGYSIQQIGWVYMILGTMLLTGSLLVGGRLGALPLRPLLVVNRILIGLMIAGLFMVPVTAIAGIGLIAVLGISIGTVGASTMVLLTKESPAGRATTMTINVSAMSLGVGLGSALGGLFLAVAGFWLLGLFALLLSCISAGLIWWHREEGAGALPGHAQEVPV
ncbi:MAG: MFS transporter [Sphaerobacteraceae bacterium]|nr:MAG: MFS transporter [Sphaerobacteraceae bacterium]